MPSIETDNYREESAEMPEKSSSSSLLDVATDVEELVAAIKHNLRLKSCRSFRSKRVSPYGEVERTLRRAKLVKRDRQNKVRASDDPYEMLQALLKEGSLIKEAVKRVQLAATGPTQLNEDDDDFYESNAPNHSATFEL